MLISKRSTRLILDKKSKKSPKQGDEGQKNGIPKLFLSGLHEYQYGVK